MFGPVYRFVKYSRIHFHFAHTHSECKPSVLAPIRQLAGTWVLYKQFSGNLGQVLQFH